MQLKVTMSTHGEFLTEENPLPACMGRVCYHTCEGKCNRGFLDESVGINSVERFLGDYAIEHNLSFKRPARETGKKVLIIGAGPASLSAAYQLRRFGHTVHIVEMGKRSWRYDALWYSCIPSTKKRFRC